MDWLNGMNVWSGPEWHHLMLPHPDPRLNPSHGFSVLQTNCYTAEKMHIVRLSCFSQTFLA